MCNALLDNNYVEVDSKGRRLVLKVNEISQIQLPDTIEALIRSRIDALTPTQQLTLKINSVLGMKFCVEDLEAIYPQELKEATSINN